MIKSPVKPTQSRSLLAQSLRANFLPVAASAATVLIVVAILLLGQKAGFDRETGFRATSLAKLVAQEAELGVVTADTSELDRIAQNALSIDDVIYVVMFSPSGVVLSSASRPAFSQGDTPSHQDMLSRNTGFTPYKNFVDAAVPVVPATNRALVDWETATPQVAGVVHIGVSTEAQRHRLQQALATVLLVSFSGVFGLGVILSIQQRRMRKVLAPLKDLIGFTRLLAGGDLTQRTAVVRDDEVGQLAKATNEMAERLQTSQREMIDAVGKAKEANRLKSEFLANMSHEIRTPLNGVLGMIDLALDGQLNVEQRDYLSTANISAHSLLGILNDILDFSKIESGRFELVQAPFDLVPEVHHLGKAYAVYAQPKGVELLCRISPGTPTTLVGDADRLRQVLQNLLSNALKFTAAGQVKLNVSIAGENTENEVRLLFEVCDTGIGIAEDKQQCIFEAFRQADGSTTRLYGGTGLGLAISSRLVHLMGGSLSVKSVLGTGSTFSFSVPFEKTSISSLPAAHSEGQFPSKEFPVLAMTDSGENLARLGEVLQGWKVNATPPSESVIEAIESMPAQHLQGEPTTITGVESQSTQLRVLLVEDNAVNQKLAMRMIERAGHSVEVAWDGVCAMEVLALRDFDCVLMDIQMPRMDGLQTTRALRALEAGTGRHIPIIAMTAHALDGDRDRCIEAGMDYYLAKPISRERLLKSLEVASTHRTVAVDKSTNT